MSQNKKNIKSAFTHPHHPAAVRSTPRNAYNKSSDGNKNVHHNNTNNSTNTTTKNSGNDSDAIINSTCKGKTGEHCTSDKNVQSTNKPDVEGNKENVIESESAGETDTSSRQKTDGEILSQFFKNRILQTL